MHLNSDFCWRAAVSHPLILAHLSSMASAPMGPQKSRKKADFDEEGLNLDCVQGLGVGA